MRFGEGSPKAQIAKLVTALAPLGIKSEIYHSNAGDIETDVHEMMDEADVFIACGTPHYGEVTQSPISSAAEVDYWREYQSVHSIVSLRMFPFDKRMNKGKGRALFVSGVNQVLWLEGEPLTDKIVQNVAKAIREAAAKGASGK